MAKKRRFSTFSLSFLDIMSCGFGAVALIFLIIKHDVDTRAENLYPNLQAEVSMLEEEIKTGRENMVRARNTVSEVDQRLAEAQGMARTIDEDLTKVRANIASLTRDDATDEISQLQERLKKLEEEKKKLEEENRDKGNNVRRFVGEGNRQYLTGLKLGGSHVLILIDSSASMLDETIVNIIRRRNMDDATKISSKKWQQALGIVEWLVAQLPERTNYQIYNFNTRAHAPLVDSEGKWLRTEDKAQLERVIDNLRKVVPENGTNLYKTFISLADLEPLPDNIFIITDGLPTLGKGPPKKNTITGPDRRKLFEQAVELLPRGIPVNTILLPMEGDPFAASDYWRLAMVTEGSFLTPSVDWP
ncbi:hypothetical protein [Halioxenophilus sp. WMMB6]|uniref:hypothetical protein n=1 Tax=Halioxenophilus sp. WMMB6 TaxID=3073815 RepID=UPI00295E3CC6|nr:hypothetical protein [Halioxenophilus sp. WMMB6]